MHRPRSICTLISTRNSSRRDHQSRVARQQAYHKSLTFEPQSPIPPTIRTLVEVGAYSSYVVLYTTKNMSKRSRASAFRLCVGLFASVGANEISSTSFAISSTSIDSHNRLIDAMVGADLVIPADKDNRALVEWDDDCQDDPNYLSPRFAAPCVFHKVVDCKGFAKVGYTDDEVFDLITHCPVSCKVLCGTWTRSPTSSPTSSPTETHSDVPSVAPTANPTLEPSASPSRMPTSYPSTLPTARPSSAPTSAPSHAPTFSPSAAPSGEPSRSPTQYPSAMPSALPTSKPSASPTSSPSSSPSASPTAQPSSSPSASPTSSPSSSPSASPTFRHRRTFQLQRHRRNQPSRQAISRPECRQYHPNPRRILPTCRVIVLRLHRAGVQSLSRYRAESLR